MSRRKGEKADIDVHQIAALQEYSTVKRWLKGKVGITRYNYTRHMIVLGRVTKQDPDQFLAWAKTKESVEVQDIIDQVAETVKGSGSQFNFKLAIRSFLRSNGFNNLPKSKVTYTLLQWHRGYQKQEILKLLSYLDDPIHKLYVYLLAETGLRANHVLAIKWKHISEDLEAGVLPVAVRFGPEFYGKTKSAGFTFLGKRSVDMIKELVKSGQIQTKPESALINRSYPVMYKVLVRARNLANLDRRLQVHHGLRKYFENALVGVDPDQRRMIEGHFATIQSKHYSSREWDDLRPVYAKAYPQIDLNTGDPELVKKLESWQEEKRQLMERFEAERTEWRRELNDLRELVKKEIADRKKEN